MDEKVFFEWQGWDGFLLYHGWKSFLEKVIEGHGFYSSIMKKFFLSDKDGMDFLLYHGWKSFLEKVIEGHGFLFS